MDLKRNWLILGAVVLLALIFFKNQREKAVKVIKDELSDLNVIAKPRIPVSPTLLQLYPEEDQGIAKFIGNPEGVPNQLISPKMDLAQEMGLDDTKETYGSIAFDLEKDGYSDLIVCMSDGIWVYKNNLSGGKPFSCKMIMAKQPGLTPVGIVIHDFDRDGNPDLYVFQVHDGTTNQAPGVILKNNARYEFVDVTSDIGPTKMSEIIGNIKKMQNGYLSDGPSPGAQFIVKMPNTVEFAGARVVLVQGTKNNIKYNVVGTGLGQNSTLIFRVNPGEKIDKVKIRTIYGKEYNYAEQKVNTILKVDPMPHFESSRNVWRSTSMG